MNQTWITLADITRIEVIKDALSVGTTVGRTVALIYKNKQQFKTADLQYLSF